MVNYLLNQAVLDKNPIEKWLLSFIQDKFAKWKLDLSDSDWITHQFPHYKDEEGQGVYPDILLITKKYGVVIFKSIIWRQLDHETMQKWFDWIAKVYQKVKSKLGGVGALNDWLDSLKITITPILYFSDEKEVKENSEINWVKIISNNEWDDRLSSILPWGNFDEEILNYVMSALDWSLWLIKSSDREVLTKDWVETMSEKLQKIESEIKTFDNQQRLACTQIIDWPQRIRGLAWSGKTIVLAMKAAYIHLTNPEANILFTFWTKSLYDQVKTLITRFYRQFSDWDPNWDKIQILHWWWWAWLPWLYYQTCKDHEINPLSFSDAVQRFGKRDVFNNVCRDLLEKINIMETYDYVIIDEWQDFPVYFYRLCWHLVKEDRIIRWYDELQNILSVDIQNIEQTFGKKNGKSLVLDTGNSRIPSDLILYKCYRNPRKVLVNAITLWMWIYNENILQMFESNDYWNDLWFKVLKWWKEWEETIIERPLENSPIPKENFLEKDDVIKVASFWHIDEEIEFVSKEIENDIKNEWLLPDDILVISLDDRNAKRYFNGLSSKLAEKDIQTYSMYDKPRLSHVFRQQNQITLTSVYSAKWNQAGKVYIIWVDGIADPISKNLVSERNKLFTAMTRSFAWVVITWIFIEDKGRNINYIDIEYKKWEEHYPNMVFTMPNLTEIRTLRREMEQKQIEENKMKREFDKLTDSYWIEKIQELLNSRQEWL